MNIDYDIYKDRFTESEYNFDYTQEDIDIYEPYDVTDFRKYGCKSR